jgi:hypothetical protein
MFKNTMWLAASGLFVVACSGGGGGSGGSGSAGAGYFAAPTASCGGTACVPGASISFAGPGDIQTMAADPSRAADIYTAFNKNFIPQLNTFLAKVYSAMKAGGSQSCSDVAMGSSGTVNGYSFSITSANKNIPTGFTKSGTSFDYRIYASVGESPVAEIQVHCGDSSATDPLTVAARVDESGAKYEFIYEKSGNKIRIMGAGILSSGGRMIAWFKTDDGDDFELAVKSNVNSITDHYVARGKKSTDNYNVQSVTGSSTVCVKSSGATGDCSALTINTPPTLAVSTSTDWSTVNVSSFTIAAP